MKGTDGDYKLSELLSGRIGSAYAVVNVTAVRTATWNLFVLYNKALKYSGKKVLMMTSSIRLSSSRS